MATLTVRDVPEEIMKALDAAAAAASARSREAYLRDFLSRAFGSEVSVGAAIAGRARKAVELFEALGRFGVLQPAPSIATIARALRHPDVSMLEAELRGDRALSFSDGDKLCELFSLDRTWLESGGDSTPQFITANRHNDCRLLLRDFLTNGIAYAELYVILSDGARSDAAIIGHTANETNPTIGWRYDLLVDQIPIHNSVGGGGRAQRRAFADLMVALYDDDLFPNPVHCIGRIAPEGQYLAAMNGYIHLSTITSTYAPGAAHAMSRPSEWDEDFWSFERSDPYTPSYNEARAALLEELRSSGIHTDAQYRAHVKTMIASWKL